MKNIPVAFDAHMVADAKSYSPSAYKPAAVMADWAQRLDALPHNLIPVRPATVEQLLTAHSGGYVADVLSCRAENGFGNTEKSVAQALPWMVGSMLYAAQHVLSGRYGSMRESDIPAACSPSSGFHHASFSRGAGFCTFNGLLITAIVLKNMGLVRKVAIIDCDYHYGDGTQEIIDHLGLKWINHWSAGAYFKRPDQAQDFMLGLPYAVKHAAAGCDLALYQAGADQHRLDPLGGLLTTEQMARRDRQVFWVLREYGVPVVWNLAGGYQRDMNCTIEPVLALHRNTMRQCVDIYVHGEEREKEVIL